DLARGAGDRVEYGGESLEAVAQETNGVPADLEPRRAGVVDAADVGVEVRRARGVQRTGFLSGGGGVAPGGRAATMTNDSPCRVAGANARRPSIDGGGARAPPWGCRPETMPTAWSCGLAVPTARRSSIDGVGGGPSPRQRSTTRARG